MSADSSNRPAQAACCSPKTPPGSPPTCKDSRTSTPLASDRPPKPLKAVEQTESELKEVDDEKIVDISEDQPDNAEDLIDSELLAELDAIAQKAYDEDTYSDVDAEIENYPDYYWQMEYEDEDG